MSIYEYTAIDDYGKRIDGELEAVSEADLEAKLASRGLYLLQCRVKAQIVKASPYKAEEESHTYQDDSSKEGAHYHVHYHAPQPGIQPPHHQGFPYIFGDFTLWTLLWLIFFWPVGLYLVWKKQAVAKWVKVTLSIVFGIAILGVGMNQWLGSIDKGGMKLAGGKSALNQPIVIKEREVSNPEINETQAQPVLGYPNEPVDGFNGIKWGTPEGYIPWLRLEADTKEEKEQSYKDVRHEGTEGEEEINGIPVRFSYIFKKGHFCGVDFVPKPSRDPNNIIEALYMYHGPETTERFIKGIKHHIWIGKRVTLGIHLVEYGITFYRGTYWLTDWKDNAEAAE